MWRKLHRCTCTAPVTLLAENKKEGREGGTIGGPLVVLLLSTGFTYCVPLIPHCFELDTPCIADHTETHAFASF